MQWAYHVVWEFKTPKSSGLCYFGWVTSECAYAIVANEDARGCRFGAKSTRCVGEGDDRGGSAGGRGPPGTIPTLVAVLILLIPPWSLAYPGSS